MEIEKIKFFRRKVDQLGGLISWKMKEEVGCCGITLAQCQILNELSTSKEVCSAKLAELLGVDSSTLCRTANRMVEAGLIDRIPNCTDRRYVSLTLTEKGQELFERIDNQGNDYYAKIFELIPEDKREQIIESFSLFAKALDTYKKQTD